jgi:tetratricopeptide (TPR) repeat protein
MPGKTGIMIMLFWSTIAISCYSQAPHSFIQLVTEAEKETASKNWKSAIPLWENVVLQNPVHIDYSYQLGNAYYQAGQYTKALKLFEKCDELTGGKSYYDAFNLAKTYAMMGDKISSLKWVKKSFELGMPNRSAFSYPAFDILKTIPEFQKISNISDVSKLNRIDGWRYDLSFLKDEILRKAYHVTRDFSREDLEKETNRIYNAIPHLTDMQITVEFIKLLAKLGDGHTMLYVMKDNPEIRKYIPVEFYWFGQGLYVIQADKRFENLLGAKVVSMEGKTPETFFMGLKPLLSKDNEQTLKIFSNMRMRQTAILHATGLAASPDNLSLKLIDRNGKEVSITLQADCNIPSRMLWDGLPENWVSLENTLSQKPLYLTNRYSWYWFKYLRNEKTVWFQYNRVLDDPKNEWIRFLDSMFRFIEKNDVEKLVIDFRNNNGGNGELCYSLIQNIIKAEKINQKGNLFAITGRKTFSAAGICIGLLEKHTQAIFAGEPAGTSPNFIGEEFEFELPYSRLFGNISDREHHYANAVDFRTWIPPTIYVDPSFEEFMNGRDAVWEGILASYPLK